MKCLIAAVASGWLLALLLSISSTAYAQTNSVPDAVEFQVLKNIYDSLAGSGWTIKTNWPATGSWPAAAESSTFGTWYGVTVTDGDISGIALNGNLLTGTLPRSLSQLTRLRSLNLSNNQVSGSIPSTFRLLVNLQDLLLATNQLAGALPASFSQLTALKQLDLGNNLLTGSFVMGTWPSINRIVLDNNQFSGAFPSQVSSAAALTYLSANNNSFTSLPAALLTAPVLTTCSFTNNALTVIPDFGTYPNKANLTLNLASNKLDFGSLELVVNRGIQSVAYNPQKELDNTSAINVAPGGVLKMQARSAGANGSVVWERKLDGGTVWSSINALNQDATQQTLNLPNFSQSDKGYYRYKLTNTAINGVTIYSVTATVRTGLDVVWNGQANVTSSGADVVKTTAAGWNSAGAIAENILPAGQAGWIEFLISPQATAQNYVVGFSTTTTYTRASLNYGIEINALSGNKVFIHELNEAGIELGTWAPGDYFRIERSGTSIIYSRNGVQIRSVTASTAELKSKVVLYSGQSPMTTSSFWIPASRGVVPDAWEFAALKDFFTSLGGSTWTKKTGWPTTSWVANITAAQMDAWYGIVVESGDITGLSFVQNNLTGQIPASLSRLTMMKAIDLRINKIGGVIPATITSLANLKDLRLYDNLITGTIPEDIGRLTNLEYLTVAKNNLTGHVPASIGQLTKLYWLGLYLNSDLGGPLPTEFYNLINLTDLYIYDTQIEGELLPQIGNLSKLRIFYGYRNKWSGPLPEALGSIATLEELYLFSNSFTGEVPASWRNLQKLRYIWLHWTSINGLVPEWFSEIKPLVSLAIGDTKMSGVIPPSYGTLPNLKELYLERLDLTGTIPEELQALTKLTIVDLKFTSLKGDIPAWLMNRSTLKEFRLNDAKFTGLPDFSARTDKASLIIYIQNNEIPVRQIEPYFTAAGKHPFKAFTYGPQRSTIEQQLTVAPGAVLKLVAPDGGVHGVYAWEKFTGGAWVNVGASSQNADPKIFELADMNEDKTGTYRYTVTNSWLPDIRFESGELHVQLFDALQTGIDNLSYQYRYDAKKRVIKKKIPGSDWVYYVYDARDRVVLSQDGNQRARIVPEWTFTKYDARNRPVLSGIYKDANALSLEQMQEQVDDFYSSRGYESAFEQFTGVAGAAQGYDNASFPVITDPTAVYSVTYYDNYRFKSLLANAQDYAYRNNELSASPGQRAQDESPQGLLSGHTTGTRVRNFETGDWLTEVLYYDDHYRTIQRVAQHHLGGAEIITNVFDFRGNVIRTRTTVTKGEASTFVIRRFTYDHHNRLLQTWHAINGGTDVLIADNTYNELGELITKNLHTVGNEAPKQRVDYRYNIRGWMTRINNSDLSDTEGGPADLFGIEYGYFENLGIGNYVPRYDGTTSAAKWSAGVLASDALTQRSHVYYYDPLNRMTASEYAQRNQSDWSVTPAYAEHVEFDLNGNIATLKRTDATGSLMDDLLFDNGSARTRSNRLLSVTERGQDSEGFLDVHETGLDYGYDRNGNLSTDLNKGIRDVTYNPYLNLTETVEKETGEKVEHVYTAGGIKLGYKIYEPGTSTVSKRYDYVGPLVYENDTLRYIRHEEGKVVVPLPGAADASLEYQYELKDLQDNIRVTFTTQEKTTVQKATMEDNGQADESNPRVREMEVFNDLFETEVTNVSQWLNHTSSSIGNAIYLDGSANRTIGPNTALKIYPGDKVVLDVYGKFEVAQSYDRLTVAEMLALLVTPIQSAAAKLDGAPQAISSVISAGLMPLLADPRGDDNEAPPVYLNYILFDNDFNVIDLGYDRIDASAGFEPFQENTVDFSAMHVEKVFHTSGYVYVYVSNESPGTRVWMDDLTITYTPSPVLQSEDYYAMGLSMTGTAFERGNEAYKGQVVTDGIGVKDLGFRQYDPALGRFQAVDPLGELHFDHSPYQYADNNPLHADVLGLDPPWDMLSKLWKSFFVKRKSNGQTLRVWSGNKPPRSARRTGGSSNTKPPKTPGPSTTPGGSTATNAPPPAPGAETDKDKDKEKDKDKDKDKDKKSNTVVVFGPSLSESTSRNSRGNDNRIPRSYVNSVNNGVPDDDFRGFSDAEVDHEIGRFTSALDNLPVYHAYRDVMTNFDRERSHQEVFSRLAANEARALYYRASVDKRNSFLAEVIANSNYSELHATAKASGYPVLPIKELMEQFWKANQGIGSMNLKPMVPSGGMGTFKEGEVSHRVTGVQVSSGTMDTRNPEITLDDDLTIAVRFKGNGETRLRIDIKSMPTLRAFLRKSGIDEDKATPVADEVARRIREELAKTEPDKKKLTKLINFAEEGDLEKFTNEEKEKVLTVLTSGAIEFLDGDEERAIISVVAGTSDENIQDLHDKLQKAPETPGEPCLLKKIIDKVADYNPNSEDGNFSDLIGVFNEQFRAKSHLKGDQGENAKPGNSETEPIYLDKPWYGKVQTQSLPKGHRYEYTTELANDGRLTVRRTQQLFIPGDEEGGGWVPEADPEVVVTYDKPLDDIVEIDPRDGSRFYNSEGGGDQIFLGPVLNLDYDIRESENDQKRNGIRFGAGVAGLAVSAWMIEAEGLAFYLGVIELGASSVNLTITVLKDPLEEAGVPPATIQQVSTILTFVELGAGMAGGLVQIPGVLTKFKPVAQDVSNYMQANPAKFSGLPEAAELSRLKVREGVNLILEQPITGDVLKGFVRQDLRDFANALPGSLRYADEAGTVKVFSRAEVPGADDAIHVVGEIRKNGTDEVFVITDQRIIDKLPGEGDVVALSKEMVGTPELVKAVGDNPELADAWKVLKNTPESIHKGVSTLATVSKWLDDGIQVTFQAIEDGAKILNGNGIEIGRFLKEGPDEILEISDDFIVSTASSSSKKFEGITVRSNTGETFKNAGFVKNADGSLGFVEDVSSYGSQLVQNAIKHRGDLRGSLAGIKNTEDAHHVIPVQLLKENDVVKKAVEGGFEFNTSKNGLAIEKFVKSTGAGRHGPHPQYTEQIRKALNDWAEATPNYTPAQAKEFLDGLTDDIKNTINTTTGKINELNLGL
ncbi:RHS repeat-associated core domain-containing protein [Chryseolinea serpens]|uniref:RHS repeat-associated core domain-containing protein n=1 Tax=Chryseolinea serpens TaxID=947013 RepID=A0A1M5XSX1_9BACT|nr:RHS repeat-associated core domain-containing protein [Chryseolinea serpens]SHI02911.1 RHS repeat-associated core domain-containing protein [Chryseolinea serpens]